MKYWAKAPMDRQQVRLFCPTLDDVIDEEHPVRLFWEVLSTRDWTSWEARYHGHRGQPAIHPRIVAGLLLYGLSQKIRSSRSLEAACQNRLDFIWLAEGRQIDHSTFCDFRIAFGQELKGLFRQIGRVAMTMGLIRLNQVALDGTRVKANSSRHHTARASRLERCLEALDEQIEQLLVEAQAADCQEDDLYGREGTPNRLPPDLRQAQRRREAMQNALEAVKELDAKRAKRKDMGSRGAQIPVADPESRVLPNKEGGSSPNYTPLVSADGHRGFLLTTDVINDAAEDKALVDMVDEASKDFEQKPEKVLADSAFGTGVNLKALEDRQIEALMPVVSLKDDPDNPALRDDPSQAIPREVWDQLPTSPQSKRLDKRAFIYDGASDRYYCPMGKSLPFKGYEKYRRKSGLSGEYRVYTCEGCSGCALAKRCLAGMSKSRRVLRDEYEGHRERAMARLADPEKHKTYDRRMWIVEAPIGVLKNVMGVRQFLVRSLAKVKIEWDWACCAFNLSKLVKEIARIRRQLSYLAE